MVNIRKAKEEEVCVSEDCKKLTVPKVTQCKKLTVPKVTQYKKGKGSLFPDLTGPRTYKMNRFNHNLDTGQVGQVMQVMQ
ncbi:hypothetical protein AXG93_2834s1280 [Marchantia polymorpha subsp. ruderalis]|uniref:Uncharacterized protein n=1 Tax=Marchantia polymorpha subsp. ruderalis TaxID=1480154 RepID=A0A176WHW5_MARPO|nr:hypothetical protein AXG93_2834s1280 [Marchantia polymorpha subsp. ruderalis]